MSAEDISLGQVQAELALLPKENYYVSPVVPEVKDDPDEQIEVSVIRIGPKNPEFDVNKLDDLAIQVVGIQPTLKSPAHYIPVLGLSLGSRAFLNKQGEYEDISADGSRIWGLKGHITQFIVYPNALLAEIATSFAQGLYDGRFQKGQSLELEALAKGCILPSILNYRVDPQRLLAQLNT